jgi:hypothetical protein
MFDLMLAKFVQVGLHYSMHVFKSKADFKTVPRQKLTTHMQKMKYFERVGLSNEAVVHGN